MAVYQLIEENINVKIIKNNLIIIVKAYTFVHLLYILIVKNFCNTCQLLSTSTLALSTGTQKFWIQKQDLWLHPLLKTEWTQYIWLQPMYPCTHTLIHTLIHTHTSIHTCTPTNVFQTWVKKWKGKTINKQKYYLYKKWYSQITEQVEKQKIFKPDIASSFSIDIIFLITLNINLFIQFCVNSCCTNFDVWKKLLKQLQTELRD